mgnify:CR=1 FL=1|tara:strand:- start:476 stop:706 length:231 start_codon:yes stop_codon:yes gene_type:complete
MTAKEKAKQLYDKMEFETKYNSQPSTVQGMCKKLALICVDEIISIPSIQTAYAQGYTNSKSNESYWHEVKQEINKL